MDINTPIDTSTHTVFGVPRRVIGFGFGIFLLLVILAVLYSQFTRQPLGPVVDTNPQPMAPSDPKEMMKTQPITGPITPDVVTDDLIDEALSEREDLNTYTEDEMADVEDGSNY